MKAFIIAGGTRMRPLSANRPKHLLPVANRPLIQYQIDRLARAGVTEAILCTNCIPGCAQEAIDEAGAAGVRLTYAVEQSPLGTGGALRNAWRGGYAPFLALNGDGLFDFEIRGAIAAHFASGVSATICTLHVDDTGPYGVIEADADGAVRAFREPQLKEGGAGRPAKTGIGGSINAGVYVLRPSALDRIPPGRAYSLERELFPALAADGSLAAFPVEGRFIDIGRPADVAAASWAVLANPAAWPIPGDEVSPGIWMMPDASVASGAEVRPPVHIGNHAVVADGARVGPLCCLGAGTRVSTRAQVADSILFENCVVEEGAVISGIVADRGSRFGEGLHLVGPRVCAAGSVVSSEKES